MRKSFSNISLLTVLVLALCLGAFLPEIALANSEAGRLHVTGSAVVTGAPDIAHITLGVETQDVSADVAAQDNASRMAKVFTALKELGLTERELSTSGYNIYSSTQVVGRGTNEETSITTYRVHNRINITTKNLDIVGEIIDRAVQAGANQVQGIQFDVEDKQAMQLKALQNAIKQGVAKAEAMAEAAGLTLTQLVSLSENYSSYAPMVNTMVMRADSFAGTTINPGEVEVSANVQLEFLF
ncbi:MAG: SIMPL domain-containing protein [Firmicutes bacterium]|nr:SIMPL domain-containing protein [Bacillota bacterium]